MKTVQIIQASWLRHLSSPAGAAHRAVEDTLTGQAVLAARLQEPNRY